MREVVLDIMLGLVVILVVGVIVWSFTAFTGHRFIQVAFVTVSVIACAGCLGASIRGRL